MGAILESLDFDKLGAIAIFGLSVVFGSYALVYLIVKEAFKKKKLTT